MTPLTLPTQITLESRVTAGPGVPVWTYSDYWGTFVSVFDLPQPHDDLVIRAAATVETEPFGGAGAGEDRPSWDPTRPPPRSPPGCTSASPTWPARPGCAPTRRRRGTRARASARTWRRSR